MYCGAEQRKLSAFIYPGKSSEQPIRRDVGCRCERRRWVACTTILFHTVNIRPASRATFEASLIMRINHQKTTRLHFVFMHFYSACLYNHLLRRISNVTSSLCCVWLNTKWFHIISLNIKHIMSVVKLLKHQLSTKQEWCWFVSRTRSGLQSGRLLQTEQEAAARLSLWI